MKKILTAITAVLLAAIMLSGCVSIEVNTRNTPAQTSLKDLTRGIIEGSVYTNESAELRFTAPEGWKYANDDEFEELMGFSVYDGLQTHDMLAYNASSAKIVIVTYEYLDLAADETISVEAYMDLVRNSLVSTYDNPEFSYHAKASIGANTFNVMSMDCPDLGMTQYYYVRRAGSYMLCIMITTQLGRGAESTIVSFS